MKRQLRNASEASGCRWWLRAEGLGLIWKNLTLVVVCHGPLCFWRSASGIAQS